MEISKETVDEIQEQRKKEYEDWNKMINSVAEEVVSLLREKQLSFNDYNEVLKVVNTIVSYKVAKLNINYILNNQ